jgi:hypothetical protein
MEGREDGIRNNWDQGLWQRVDIKGWTKAKMWWWWSPFTAVGRQEL